ncbi:MAG: SpoIIE family protein phosphatase, partial [Myxococcales bacterium]|nr:SpoIIE family protein phosphatase [Myxococcales bacterium]
MQFRSTIMLGTSAVLAAVIATTVGVVAVTLERDARRTVTRALERSELVFEELQGYRQSLYRAQAEVVSQAPRLKAAASTDDIDHATLLDVSRELQQSAGADFFLLTDGAGRLLVDVAAPDAEGFDLSARAPISTAIEAGEGADVWITDERVIQLQAFTLRFGQDVVGVLAIGFFMDDRVADTVERQTGAKVVIALNGDAIARSQGTSDAELAGALTRAEAIGESQVVTIDGAPHVVVTRALPGYGGEEKLSYLLLQSLDDALATSRALRRNLILIALAGLLISLLLAVWVARRLSRPLDRLVGFTRELAAGRLDARQELSGPTEVQALGRAMNQMAGELAESRKQLAGKERLERELEIAERIQTSILPRAPEVNGYAIASEMTTASEVGGDYFDVLPAGDRCWIGIGDVAGHGLKAGLVMLMVQSCVAALVREQPTASPADHVRALNRVLVDNIRERLEQDEHVTFSLLRIETDGRVVYAGAHEEMIVCRAATGACELIPTPGTWLGVDPNIDLVTRDSELRLEDGDLLLLYTDGLTEARSPAREMFGVQRLADALAR